MNVVSTQYTLSTKSLEIYLAGCNGQPKCKNCHNPMLWDFNVGEKWDYGFNSFSHNLATKIKSFSDLIENIMIFGGEPLDQDIDELIKMIISLRCYGYNIWVFTRYDINEVPKEIKQYCDYIKCGRYIEELSTDDNIQYGIKLATSNQHIYKKGIDY